jgi:ribosomal protein L34E
MKSRNDLFSQPAFFLKKGVARPISSAPIMEYQSSYKEYLQTPYWKEVSRVVKRRYGFRCGLCNSPLDLCAHHRTYEHRGKELDHLDDLICLCKKCHRTFHAVEREESQRLNASWLAPSPNL